MLHILHAGDFHLDSPFAALNGEQAIQRRKEQRRLLDSLLQEAQQADLCFLTGDLLDSSVCYGETVEALERFLNALPCPAFLAPGNHDYYAAESPWLRMKLPDSVHIFRSGTVEAVELPELDCTVYGAAFLSPQSEPLLRGFHAPGQQGLQLMLIHGEVTGGDSVYDPISEADIQASGLHYLALGHVHSFSGLQKSGSSFWAYPGCLMGRGFDEQGDKGCLHVYVDRESCNVSFCPLPSRRYLDVTADLTGAADMEAGVLSALPQDCAGDILRVTLRGETAAQPDLAALRQSLSRRCFALTLRDETRLLSDPWAGAEEDTLRGGFLRLLKEQYLATEDEAEREKIMLARRFGVAALENREEA